MMLMMFLGAAFSALGAEKKVYIAGQVDGAQTTN
jgi:hypothetical protein